MEKQEEKKEGDKVTHVSRVVGVVSIAGPSFPKVLRETESLARE